MNTENISFSSDNDMLSRKDLDETSKITEDYFSTKNDESQIRTSKQNRDWIYKNIRDYINVIRNNKEIIGYAFMLPCNKLLMRDFLDKKISEAKLFEEIKRIDINGTPETIYLCASVLKESFRGKGLATTAFVKVINKISQKGIKKLILFYWEYSEEGVRLANRVSELTGLELRVRKD